MRKRRRFFCFRTTKGLKENELAVADQAMHDFYMRFAPQVIEASGSSAGGGMGAGLLAFASGKIVSGIDYVLDLLEFDKRVQQADLVIVGEGRLDGQSLKGKAPVGIARRVPEGVPVIAICGSIGKGSEKAADVGISAVFRSFLQLCLYKKLYSKPLIIFIAQLKTSHLYFKSFIFKEVIDENQSSTIRFRWRSCRHSSLSLRSVAGFS